MESITANRNNSNASSKYFEYFVPTLLTAMATNLSSIINSVLAGTLVGSDALVTIMLYTPLTQAIFASAILLGLGGSTVVAKQRGRGENSDATRTFTLSVVVGAFLGCAALVVMMAMPDAVVGALTQESGTEESVRAYYTPFVIGVPFNIVFALSLYFVRVDGKPKYATATVIVSNVVNLIMDWVLMGPIALGVAGAAIATDISLAAGLAMTAAHYLGMQRLGRRIFDLSALTGRYKPLRSLVDVLTTGTPGALSAIFAAMRIAIFNSLLASVGGKPALAAFAVCTYTQILMYIFVTGAAQAMVPIASVLHGEGDFRGVRATFRLARKVLIA